MVAYQHNLAGEGAGEVAGDQKHQNTKCAGLAGHQLGWSMLVFPAG